MTTPTKFCVSRHPFNRTCCSGIAEHDGPHFSGSRTEYWCDTPEQALAEAEQCLGYNRMGTHKFESIARARLKQERLEKAWKLRSDFNVGLQLLRQALSCTTCGRFTLDLDRESDPFAQRCPACAEEKAARNA